MRAHSGLMLLLLVCISLALGGCARDASTRVEVVNHSGQVLTEISLAGSGFSAAIERLDPGETAWLRVEPVGESGVAASFTAGGRRYGAPAQGYFEPGGGYRVTVTIRADLSADVESNLY
jgi:hypothetical protein